MEKKRSEANKNAECSACKHSGQYTTGGDEYPAYTVVMFCKRHHWSGDPDYATLIDKIDCNDFEQLKQLTK